MDRMSDSGDKNKSRREFQQGVAERLRWLMDTPEPKIRTGQLAEYCGVASQAVSRWRSNGKIEDLHKKQICEFFGVSLDWFISGDEKWGRTMKDREWLAMGRGLTDEQVRHFRAVYNALKLPDGKANDN